MELIVLYIGDVLFLASLATVILKLQLEESSKGFSAKTQGVYVVIFLTRYVDLIFDVETRAYIIVRVLMKIIYITCSIYIVLKIRSLSRKDTCNCNQDSVWVEALVVPCIVITAAYHAGPEPEKVLWSFSTYLEIVAMLPQLYLLHVRGKGDSYLPTYIYFMACYSFCGALAYSLGYFISGSRSIVWVICKYLQLLLYLWYFFIPKEPVLPTLTCTERRRRPTLFMRQESMLAQSLLQKKNNSANDLQVFVITPPGTPCLGKFPLSGTPQSIRKGMSSAPCTPQSIRKFRFPDSPGTPQMMKSGTLPTKRAKFIFPDSMLDQDKKQMINKIDFCRDMSQKNTFHLGTPKARLYREKNVSISEAIPSTNKEDNLPPKEQTILETPKLCGEQAETLTDDQLIMRCFQPVFNENHPDVQEKNKNRF